MKETPTQSRVEWLDGVRAIAALFVVLHHTWLLTFGGFPGNDGPRYLDILVYGHLAVAVFIVVSGFSLTLGPARRSFVLREGAVGFYRRRFWRIVPPYWAALLLSAAIVWIGLIPTVTGSTLTVRDFLIHFVLLQDTLGNTPPNGTFWSIAIEVHIYLFFPILLWSLRRFGTLAVGLVVVALVVALHVAGSYVPFFNLFDRYTPQFFALFAFGMLASSATSSKRAFGATSAVVFVGVTAVAAIVGTTSMVAGYFWVDLAVGFASACAFAALVTRPMSGLRRFLELKFLRFVGAYAYSLYLVHGPILEIVRQHVIRPAGLGGWSAFLVMLTLGAPLALLSGYGFFRLFERPFLLIRSVAQLRTAVHSGLRAVRPRSPLPNAAKPEEFKLPDN